MIYFVPRKTEQNINYKQQPTTAKQNKNQRPGNETHRHHGALMCALCSVELPEIWKMCAPEVAKQVAYSD